MESTRKERDSKLAIESRRVKEIGGAKAYNRMRMLLYYFPELMMTEDRLMNLSSVLINGSRFSSFLLKKYNDNGESNYKQFKPIEHTLGRWENIIYFEDFFKFFNI